MEITWELREYDQEFFTNFKHSANINAKRKRIATGSGEQMRRQCDAYARSSFPR